MTNQELIKCFGLYKSKATSIKRLSITITLALIFITFAIFTFISNGNPAIWLYSVIIALIIVCVALGIVSLLLHNVDKGFKEEFLKRVVKSLDFDCLYTHDEILSKDDLLNISVLPNTSNYTYQFIEFLKGNIYDYSFKSAFVTIKKDDKTINYIPFKGRIFIIDYIQNNEFLVYEKNTEYSPKLNNLTYNDDVIEIYGECRILRPHIIKKLSAFLGKKKMRVSIEFKNNKIYITSWDLKDKYALSDMNTINNISQDYIHEFNLIKELMDIMEL